MLTATSGITTFRLLTAKQSGTCEVVLDSRQVQGLTDPQASCVEPSMIFQNTKEKNYCRSSYMRMVLIVTAWNFLVRDAMHETD